MKKITIVLLTLIFISVGSTQAQNYYNPNADPNCSLIWEDQFNGTTLDANKWIKAEEFDHYGEQQVYLEENAFLDNGNLVLHLEKEEYSCTDKLHEWGCKRQVINNNVPYQYRSGWIETTEKYNVSVNTYTEALVKVPYGNGYWPAFWLFKGEGTSLDNLDYCEIDIFEMVGFLPSTKTTTCIHGHVPNFPNFGDMTNGWDINLGGTLTSYDDVFLLYGVKWEHDLIKFYINGYLIREIENLGQTAPMRVVLNFALLSDTHSSALDYKYPVDPLMADDVVRVDYVKVWDLDASSLDNQKEPYIINPSVDKNLPKSRVQFNWQLHNYYYTSSSGYCKIEYGTNPNALNYSLEHIPQRTSDHLYSIVVGSLLYSTEYYYKITVEGLAAGLQPFQSTYSFRSPPSQDALNTKFYAYGDTRGASQGDDPPHHDEVCSQIVSEITSDNASKTLLINAGDWCQWDTELNWHGEYFRSGNANANKLRSMVSVMGVKGNHEAEGIRYKKYFPFPYKNNFFTGDNFSYSFDYGPVHFTMLYVDNYGYEISQTTKDWLDWDLSTTTKKWKVLVFHAPVNTLNYETAGAGTIAAIKQKAKQYGVQAVIMGHTHHYAHWIEDGTNYMILGGGGSPITSVKKSLVQSSDEVYVATVPHFAKFDVQGDLMMVDVIQGDVSSGYAKGRKIEQFSIPFSTEITSNYNFNNPVTNPVLAENITIKQGGTLTVNSSINMLKQGVITVEKGGKLIVDGSNAIITNRSRATEYLNFDGVHENYTEDGAQWNGIVVKGDPALSQTPESNQGVLEIKNQAQIKNAGTGIYVGQITGSSRQGGGIIRIKDAHFFNNQTDIMMSPYHFIHWFTGEPMFQKSYIRTSTFKHDQNILLDNYFGFGKAENIGLNGIVGIKIQGNIFENLGTGLPLSERSTGIRSNNSSPEINPYCGGLTSPCSPIYNQFKNLNYGVYAIEGMNSTEITKISENTFTNTYRSIFLSGSIDAVITQNTISIPNYDAGTGNVPYGIYLNGGKGFKVEENTLSTLTESNVFNGARGIIVHKTGAVDNEIYKNTFYNLFISQQAQCYNSGSDDAFWPGYPDAKTGLKFFCNTSQTATNSWDMWVGGEYYCTPSVSTTTGAYRSGIAKYQKQGNSGNGQNPYLPAGNRFSDSHIPLPNTYVVDFDNGLGGGRLEYSWDDLDGNGSDGWKPTRKVGIDNTWLEAKTDVCPPRSSSGTGSNYPQLYGSLDDAQVALNSSITVLSIWQDGGNVHLENEVKTTQSWDVYRQFNSLLGESPYLSEEVLMEVINNSSFTSLMVKLLMIANPHGVNSGAVMNALLNRIPALPQSYIDEIESQPETISQLQLLEGNVAADNHRVSMICEDIKRMYRSDTLNQWVGDSLRDFLSRRPGLYDHYELATLYLSYGQYDDMHTLLNRIEINFTMDETMQEDFTNFESLMDLAQDMYVNNWYKGSLLEEDFILLETVLNDDRPLIAPLALSLLKRHDPDYIYNEVVYNIPQGEGMPKSKALPRLALDTELDSQYGLYPNPTQSYTTLRYHCGYSDLSYTLVDLPGRVLQTGQLETHENRKVWETTINLTRLSPGNYQLIVKTKKVTLWNTQLIITN